jgi:hypothetical protein
MPTDTTVTIYNGNTADGTLQSSDNGYILVDQYDRIHWIIASNSNVASIKKIHKKDGAPNLFIFGPSREGNGWTGRVMFAPKKDYDYYITWIEKGTGTPHTYDPKIAVKPGVHFFLLLFIVALILGLAFVGIRRLVSAKR